MLILANDTFAIQQVHHGEPIRRQFLDETSSTGNGPQHS
jgi:hypothetical protein